MNAKWRRGSKSCRKVPRIKQSNMKRSCFFKRRTTASFLWGQPEWVQRDEAASKRHLIKKKKKKWENKSHLIHLLDYTTPRKRCNLITLWGVVKMHIVYNYTNTEQHWASGSLISPYFLFVCLFLAAHLLWFLNSQFQSSALSYIFFTLWEILCAKTQTTSVYLPFSKAQFDTATWLFTFDKQHGCCWGFFFHCVASSLIYAQ